MPKLRLMSNNVWWCTNNNDAWAAMGADCSNEEIDYDNTDNRFNPPVGRFPTIEEDEPPYRLLCNEYPAAK